MDHDSVNSNRLANHARPHAGRAVSADVWNTLPRYALPVTAIGMLIGVVADDLFAWPMAAYALVFVVCVVVLALRLVRWMVVSVLLLLVAAASAGATMHATRIRSAPPDSIRHCLPEDRTLARVRGVVASTPRVQPPPDYSLSGFSYGASRSVFELNVQAVEVQRGGLSPASGRLRVTVKEPVLDLREGERVELLGWLSPFRPPQNPGGFDWATHFRRQGVEGRLVVEQRSTVRRLAAQDEKRAGGRQAGSMRSRLSRWRTGMQRRVRAWLSEDFDRRADRELSLLQAMVIGHRSRLDRDINDMFISAGCIHFLAVSGLHVLMVIVFVRAGTKLVWSDPRKRTWTVLIFVWAYVVLAEPRPSILRAGLMATFYCIGLLLNRPGRFGHVLAATAIVLVCLEPGMLFSVGYQLSFVAVLGVVYLAPAVHECVVDGVRRLQRLVARPPLTPADQDLIASARRYDRFRSGWWQRWPASFGGYVSRLAAVSLAAWVATAPIVALHFYRIQPWGVLNSILVMPLVAVVMLVGFGKVLVSALLPVGSGSAADALLCVDRWLIDLVKQLSLLPGHQVTTAPPGPAFMVGYYVLLAAFAYYFQPDRLVGAERRAELLPSERPRTRGGQRAARVKPAGGVALVGGLVLCGWLAAQAVDRDAPALRITVLAVGNGSATVIELPTGETLLYDAGTLGPFDVGRYVVVPYLRYRGIDHLDQVMLSHPNLDHFSAVVDVLRQMPAKEVIVSPCFIDRQSESSATRRLVQELDELTVPVREQAAGERIVQFGDVLIDALWPPAGLGEDVAPNDTSLVLRIAYRGHAVLLTGDIEELGEAGSIKRGGLHADVLVLPHHGSVVETTPDFLRAVGASVLVRSSGQSRNATTNALYDVAGDTPVFNTADCGAITIVIDDVLTVEGMMATSRSRRTVVSRESD